MIDIIQWIGSVAGIIAVVLFVIFKKGAQKYVDEKAKNLATIEDTAKITQEVEVVKALHLRQSHAWKWVFEKEYQILQKVWDSTWDFQATARSLRPIMDRLPEDEEKKRKVFLERHKYHVDAANAFKDVVLKNKPFIPPIVYEACLELRSLVVELQVDFEMSFGDDVHPDWKRIHEGSKKLDAKLEDLNLVIREYVHTKINDAQQAGGLDALSGASDL